jgi:hypothetical protein
VRSNSMLLAALSASVVLGLTVAIDPLPAAAAVPAKEPDRFTTTIPTDGRGSPNPTWIEGPDDTILMAYGYNFPGDNKVRVASSSDAGLSWEEIATLTGYTTLDSPYNYLSRRADGSLAMVVVRGPHESIGWVHSLNHGRTWSEFHPIPVDSPPGYIVYTYGPIKEMSDGRWVFCPYMRKGVGEQQVDGNGLVLWSDDRGKTWGKPIPFPRPKDGNVGCAETAVLQLDKNRYLAAIRSDDIKNGFDGFYLSRSEDGRSWSVPAPLEDIGRMPLFYRIGDYWALAYRQFVPADKAQYSVVRLSRDGGKWSKPLRIEKGVDRGPFLVQVKGKVIAMNDRYPGREHLTRHVIDIAELARRGE